MHVESLKLTNFQCFGPNSAKILLDPGTTSFIGANGSGKTAAMQALQRLFGITSDSRRIRRQDFHVPSNEVTPPKSRSFNIEAVLVFPELRDPAGEVRSQAVASFWRQMSADPSGDLRCRVSLQATWNDNGVDGTVDDDLYAIQSLDEDYDPETTRVERVPGAVRSQIQFVYIPAARDAGTQVALLLRGRLWKAISWSQELKDELTSSGSTLNRKFNAETGIGSIATSLGKRWREVHGRGLYSEPILRSVETNLHDFVKNVSIAFKPDETGRDRDIIEMSDGQRSMFCIALVAASLDVEKNVRNENVGFDQSMLLLPALTLVGVEEPENNLMPFYLSRIMTQLRDITQSPEIQAVVSSHSASVLSRVEPEEIRHFQLNSASTSKVKPIVLPADDAEAMKYIREAVRSYPELYFAKFVVLGEGSSEEIVLPQIAEALGTPIDRSFVALVPLGGRHVNHLWRLLADLDIAHATLLDLDMGRNGGGAGRIKYVVGELERLGVSPDILYADGRLKSNLSDAAATRPQLDSWIEMLKKFNVFFSDPLDIDMSMLTAFPSHYMETGGPNGPSSSGDAQASVLGDSGNSALIDDSLPYDWYRYLFLGRGKPTTHALALAASTQAELRAGSPAEIRALIASLSTYLDSLESTVKT